MTISSFKYTGVAILSALVYAGPALAQGISVTEKTWVTTVTDSLDSAWSTVKDYTTPSSGRMISKSLIHDDKSSTSDFKMMMDAAGYKVKEIKTGVGLVPYLSLTFGQARELSEADEAYVHRLLRKYERKSSTPLAMAERTIVRAVLDVQELRGYKLEKVNVDLLPLPSVKFYGVPKDAPLSEEGSRIIQAVERLNESLVKQSTPR